MYTIEMLPAAQGDCLWVEYGREGGVVNRILIDGGTVGTIDHLRAKIEAVAAVEGRCHFELVVVTHVDGDHIEGIIKMLGEPSLPVDIDDIWFNGHDHLPDPDEPERPEANSEPDDEFLGAKQGDFLSALLNVRGLPWNQQPWEGGTVYVPPRSGGPLPRHTLSGGMELTLLSPNREQLLKLAKRWDRELEKAGILNWTEEEALDALLASRTLAPEDEFLSDDDDIDDVIDVAALAAAKERSDHSPANGSSIAFIGAFDGKSCLFSGDAYSSVLEDNLDRLADETGESPVVITAFKTPHHGSQNNVHRGVLQRMTCRQFLISTSGARFKHPDGPAIARLVERSGEDEPVELFFNYSSPFSDPWDAGELKRKWNYTTHYPDAAMGEEDAVGIRVDLD